MTDPEPNRPWFQYSLRTLLLFVTLCAVLCSWLVPKIKESLRESQRRSERQLRSRDAREAIAKVGGEVVTAVMPEHGIDYGVVLKGSSVGDDDLKLLLDLEWISGLHLDGTQVTDTGLEVVKKLQHLTYLQLKNTKVTDDGVRKLQQALPNCKIER